MSENPKKKKTFGTLDNGSGLAIGISLGLIFGLAMDNLAIGIALGVAVGVAIGQKKDTDEKDQNTEK